MGSKEQVKVVIVGGGVAALEALLALRKIAEGYVATELIARQEDFIYRPLSVAEPFALGKTSRYSLAEIAADNNAKFTYGHVESIDTERKAVVLETGERIEYEILLIAVGTQMKTALPGALTFKGSEDVPKVQQLLAGLSSGEIQRVGYVMPRAVTWPLPLYELALMTANYLKQNQVSDRQIVFVTAEEAPLMIAGEGASNALSELLNRNGIEVHLATYPRELQGGRQLLTTTEGVIEADKFVTLPHLYGPHLKGLPHDHEGFLTTDLYGKVLGEQDVFAAGDSTSFPIKQGGLATQQADAAAESIAAAAGAPVEPKPFKPVIRGLLLTGQQPKYLSTDLESDLPDSAWVDEVPLWWPPAKIVGRYLAPYLAITPDISIENIQTSKGTVPVEVEIEIDRTSTD